MFMFIIGLLLMFGNTLTISGASSCPDKQVEHHIPETKELRCCFPIQIKIGYEFIPCLKNGTNDTQKLCGELEYQPDEGSSMNEYFCYDVKVALNCDTVETAVITHGSKKICVCNLERGYCGLDHLLCRKIELLNCPRHNVRQDCTCIQPTSSPTVTSKEKRPSYTITAGTINHITDSQQLPTIQVQPEIDEKKPNEPHVIHKDVEVNNKEVQENVTSNIWYCLGIIAAVITFGTTAAISLYCVCQRRGLQWNYIAGYICSHGDSPNSVSTTPDSTSINDSIETSSETTSRQTHLKQIRYTGGGVNSDANLPLLRSSKSKDSSKPMAVVSPTLILTEFSSVPAWLTSDIYASTQDPGYSASFHSIEEIPRPELHSIPCPRLSTRSLDSTGIDRVSEEAIMAAETRTPETNMAQATGQSSEVSQSREVSLAQETRQKSAAHAENTRAASDFGNNTHVKEFRRNSGQIQQLTKGSGATFNGGAEARAELPINVSYLEENTTQDPENTELKVVKPTIAANFAQNLVLMEGAGIPITNELIQPYQKNELEPQSQAKLDTSDTLNLAFHSVVSDPTEAQPEQLCSNDESRDLVNYSNNETSHSYQTLMISNNLLYSLSADSLENTDSNKDQI